MPLRLAASVFVLVALLVGVGVFAGAHYERARLLRTGAAHEPPLMTWAPRQPPVPLVAAGLLMLAAAGTAVLMTFLHVRTISHTVGRIRNLMRNVLESIPTGVLTLEARGCVTSINGAAERLLELRGSAVLGRPCSEGLLSVPDLTGWIRCALDGQRLVQETDLLLAVNSGRRVTIRASAAELRDGAGQPDGLVVLLRDVTDLSRLESQLRRADKLAALGTLASGVAHEIKNPLYALSLNLHLLETDVTETVGLSDDARGYVDILRFELERLDRIVENFLRFSKPSLPEVNPVDLHAVLERVLGLIAYEAAGHGATIQTHFDRAMRCVSGDEGQLSQVFLNLGINAIQAMPGGGTLVVRTRLEGGWVEVAIQDSGAGIRDDVLPHIFDPYFTTRPSGLGLGLAIAHRIVAGHGGSIDVESGAGTGTVMTVRLPVSAGGSEAVAT